MRWWYAPLTLCAVAVIGAVFGQLYVWTMPDPRTETSIGFTVLQGPQDTTFVWACVVYGAPAESVFVEDVRRVSVQVHRQGPGYVTVWERE